ncbi:MAG TPA: hypothetical protein G4N92_01870 [Anaerolineae bacterium]|nr:hypothetical protein [Anaerolineae bacterium]
MLNAITSFSQKKYFVPLALLVVCILTYALLIPFLGFYWDGWPYLWQYHVFGPEGYPEFVASDRPYSSFIFVILSALFGTKAIYYHSFILLSRWLSAVAFWWILDIIWPKRKKINIYAAFLFTVYPGFLQQPISLPYSHHLSHMAFFLLSIAGMLYSIKKPKTYWWLTLLSLIASTLMFSLEYFATLELIRPLLIWILLEDLEPNKKKRLWKTIRYWSTYFILLAYFFIWRIFIFKFPTYQPKLLGDFSQGVSQNIGSLFGRTITDLYTVSVRAWSGIFQLPKISEYGYPATYAFWGLLAISFLSTSLFFYIQERKWMSDGKAEKPWKWGTEMILVGSIATLLAGGIVWVTKLPVNIEFAWDRLTLPFIFGVSLIFAGLIYLIRRPRLLRPLIMSILVSGAITFHFLNAVTFMHDWKNFKAFLWQLSWRIPDLKEGTIILTTDFPLKYYSDNSLTSPLNWTYAPDSKTDKLKFVFYYTDVRLKSGRLTALEKDLEIYQPYRSFYFKGNTSNSLVLKYEPPGCLHIMDQIYANAGILPTLTQLEADAIPLSNLTQIITNPKNLKSPPLEIIGEEPAHNWCYFFEKADLARQIGDWDEIVRLGDEAASYGFKPRIPSEWLPFMEAYARVGNWDKVEEIAAASLTNDNKYVPGLCFTWRRMSNDPVFKDNQHLIDLLQGYKCR